MQFIVYAAGQNSLDAFKFNKELHMEVHTSNENLYRSPLKKLVIFFESARDKWRTKCHEKQMQIRQNKIRIRDLTVSRDKWKKKATAAQKELDRTKKKLK